MAVLGARNEQRNRRSAGQSVDQDVPRWHPRPRQGRLVLLSTHIVDDVESLCERLSILAGGRIVAEGTPADLTAPLEGRLWSRVVPRGEPLPDGVLHVSATPAGSRVVLEAPAAPGEAWAPQVPRLEDVYHAAIARVGVRDEEAVA